MRPMKSQTSYYTGGRWLAGWIKTRLSLRSAVTESPRFYQKQKNTKIIWLQSNISNRVTDKFLTLHTAHTMLLCPMNTYR